MDPRTGGPDFDDVIRISREDATDQHVDDMLRRQASLRGERGITRSRATRWYYRSWFVLSVAGAIGAVAAWAVMEPVLDDLLYVQGRINEIEILEPPTQTIQLDSVNQFELVRPAVARIVVDGQPMWMLADTGDHTGGARLGPADPAALVVGQTIGAHVEYYENTTGPDGVIIRAVDTSPPPAPPGISPRQLPQLSARDTVISMLLFPVVAALVGLAIGAADGLVCRLLRRVILAGAVGLLAGFIGGFISEMLAGLVYLPLTALAMQQSADTASGLSTMGFLTQMGGRGLAWCIAGMAMGLGQGIALRSGRLLLYGFLGGLIGGLLGGLLFDPIDLILLGSERISAHWSRLAGFTIIGATVGAMIGVVELLARDAWLQMVRGPLAGKEFLLFKDRLQVGSSPRDQIYLFNDPDVSDHHATIRTVGGNYEIEATDEARPVAINGRLTGRARMHHGDQVQIGNTVFVFQRRRAD